MPPSSSEQAATRRVTTMSDVVALGIGLNGCGIKSFADLRGRHAGEGLAPASVSDTPAREYRKVRWPDPASLLALRAAREALQCSSEAAPPPHTSSVDLILCTDQAGHDSRTR